MDLSEQLRQMHMILTKYRQYTLRHTDTDYRLYAKTVYNIGDPVVITYKGKQYDGVVKKFAGDDKYNRWTVHCNIDKANVFVMVKKIKHALSFNKRDTYCLVIPTLFHKFDAAALKHIQLLTSNPKVSQLMLKLNPRNPFIRHVIVIYTSITSPSLNTIKKLKIQLYVEAIESKTLLYDPITHTYTPKHVKATTYNIQQLRKSRGNKYKDTLGTISVHDVVSKIYYYKCGDVIKVYENGTITYLYVRDFGFMTNKIKKKTEHKDLLV